MPHFSTLILAQAPAPTVKPPPDGLNMMVMMLFFFAMMYLLMIRPQQKRQKELAAQIAATKTGDRVVTSGGIHGIIANVKEKTFVLKVADNVKIEIDKSAVATVLKVAEAGAAESAG
jgi:preprotein translocase subunit YajC